MARGEGGAGTFTSVQNLDYPIWATNEQTVVVDSKPIEPDSARDFSSLNADKFRIRWPAEVDSDFVGI